MPSGARSISTPASVMVAKPATSRSSIVPPGREPGDVGLELDALLLGVPERERDVRRLDLRSLVRALRDPEHVAVELDRPLHVARRNGDEVDLLDLHGYGVLSVCGA